MCYPAELTGSQNSCQLNMRRISIVCNNVYAILLYCYFIIFMFLYLYIFIYNCMFVSALPNPTRNSEKSATGENKQILLLSLLLLLLLLLLLISHHS